jgi:hypothetical protein
VNQVASPSHRRWTNHVIVREVDKHRTRWLWGMFAAFLLASAPFGAYLLEQNTCLSLSIRAVKLQEDLDRLDEEAHRLSMDYNRMTSLHRIEPWALKERGLVRPTAGQSIVVGLPRTASKAP